MKIKKGDTVKILSGKDRGKTGKVLWALPAAGKAVVDGLNLYKKRSKPKKQGQKGEVILVPRPMHISSLMLVCASCKKATRVGFRIEKEKKIRYCKKCGAAA